MTEDSKPPIPIGSSSTRFDRLNAEVRVKVQKSRRPLRATLTIQPYRVPDEGGEVVPIRSETTDE